MTIASGELLYNIADLGGTSEHWLIHCRYSLVVSCLELRAAMSITLNNDALLRAYNNSIMYEGINHHHNRRVRNRKRVRTIRDILSAVGYSNTGEARASVRWLNKSYRQSDHQRCLALSRKVAKACREAKSRKLEGIIKQYCQLGTSNRCNASKQLMKSNKMSLAISGSDAGCSGQPAQGRFLVKLADGRSHQRPLAL